MYVTWFYENLTCPQIIRKIKIIYSKLILIFLISIISIIIKNYFNGQQAMILWKFIVLHLKNLKLQ